MKDINFLKKEALKGGLAKKKESSNLTKNLLVISVVAVVAIYAICLGTNLFLNLRINQLNKQINEYGEVVKLKEISARCNENISIIKKLVDSQNQKRYLSDTIKIVGSKAIDNVVIKEYILNDNGILELSGEGISKEGVIQFAEVLRTSGNFISVKLNNVGVVNNEVKGQTAQTTRFLFKIDIVQ